MLHLFVYCEKIKSLWLKAEQFMEMFNPEPINFQEDTVLWSRLIDNPSNIKNFICLVIKHHIYRNRCMEKDLKFREVERIINELEQYERHYAVSKNILHKHDKKLFRIATPSHRQNFIIEYIDQM